MSSFEIPGDVIAKFCGLLQRLRIRWCSQHPNIVMGGQYMGAVVRQVVHLCFPVDYMHEGGCMPQFLAIVGRRLIALSEAGSSMYDFDVGRLWYGTKRFLDPSARLFRSLHTSGYLVIRI